MTLIDQRIIIDAPPDVVWQYLTEPDELRRWHTGYASVSLLTQTMGEGARRRCAIAGGNKDIIEEITAWVNGWGYEYVIVEGGPFKQYRARLRLQTGPDGTIVNWTVFYLPKGLFGGLADRLGGRRQMARMMADSLRALRRRIDELGIKMDADYRARVSIRDRLNFDERTQYQRRYPPSEQVQETLGAEAEDLVAGPNQADSTPGDVPPASATTPPVPTGPVPSFVDQLTREAEVEGQEESFKADTEPKPPPGLREEIQQAQTAAPPPDATDPEGTPAYPDDRSRSPFARPEFAHPTADRPPQPSAADLEAHQRPTPPRGIPSVRPTFAHDTARTSTPETPAPQAADQPHPAPDAPPGDVPAPRQDDPQPVPPPVQQPTPDALAPPDPALPPVPRDQQPTPPRGIPAVKGEPSEDDSAPDTSFRRPADSADRPAPTPDPAPSDTERADSLERAAPPVTSSPPSDPASDADPRRPPQTPAHDTGEISIWDVFGVERPSAENEAALTTLIDSVYAREQGRERAVLLTQGYKPRLPVRVRRLHTVIGWRLKRMRQLAHVRLRPFRPPDAET